MVTQTDFKHIIEDETGDAFIEGTRVSVAQIAVTLDFGKRASESDIERLVKLYPGDYLSLAKIHSALAYFYEDKDRVLKTIRDVPPQFKKDEHGNWVYRA